MADEILTAANQLTLLRIVLVPVFALCVLYGMPGWALFVFTAAGVTDLFDGLIARSSGRSTTIGAWLDPMADKLLLLTMFVVLTMPGLGLTNRLPLWLTVVVISRDLGIVLSVAIVNLAVSRRTFRPSLLGKAATLVYILTGIYTLFANYERVASRLVVILEYVCLVLTMVSAAQYLVRIAAIFKGGARSEEAS